MKMRYIISGDSTATTGQVHKHRGGAVEKYRRLLLASAATTFMFSVATAQADENTILIGFAGPLSGNSSKMGQSQLQAVELAIQEANAQAIKINGKKITFKLVSGDDRGDARTAVLIAEYLVRAGVVGVVGHWNTAASIAAAPVYAKAAIPQIAAGSTGRQYTNNGFPGSFRIVGHDDDGGARASTYAIQVLNARRIALIDDGTLFGRNLAATFINSLPNKGADHIVAQESVSANTSDFNQQLNRIRDNNPDLVFFAGLGAQAAALAHNMRRMKMETRLMAADGTVGALFTELAGEDGEGTLGLAPGLSEEKMPGWKSFEKKYKARKETNIEYFAPYAYDATQILVTAIREGKSHDGAKIIATLHNLRYNGLTGTIGFDQQGNLLNASYTMYQLMQKRWVPVRTFNGTR